jgi:hypothetical protein
MVSPSVTSAISTLLAGVVEDVRPVRRIAGLAQQCDGATIPLDDLVAGHIVATLSHTLPDAGNVDVRVGGGHEVQVSAESLAPGLAA